MKPAFHTYQASPAHGCDHDLLELLELTASSGFERVGIDAASLDLHRRRGGSVADVRATLDRLGLGATDVLHLSITPDRAADDANAERRLDEAVALGAPWVLVAVPEPVDPDQMHRTLVDIGARYHDAGVGLALEFCSYAHLGDLVTSIELGDAIGWDRCGLVLDVLHFMRTGARLGAPEWAAMDRLTAEQIAFVQLSDAPAAPPRPPVGASDESRDHRLFPGDGELPITRFLAAVEATGFDGDVVTEVLSTEVRVQPLAESVSRTYAALTAAIAAVGAA